MRVEVWNDGVMIDAYDDGLPSPPSPAPVILSKLKLRRALRVAGLEDAFEQALDANPEVRCDWDDAVEIHADDPLLIDVLPAFAAAMGITSDQVDDLLREAST